MPGRLCTGNPSPTGTVSMPRRNTWLLCLPANFQRKHKVEREKKKTRKRREAEIGCKGRKPLFLLAAYHLRWMFSRACTKIPNGAGQSKMSSLYPNQKCSFHLSRQSRLSLNNMGFCCAKENIAIVMQKAGRKGKKSAGLTFLFM